MRSCAHCGSTDNLEIHHLVYRCNGGGDGETETLCRSCHVALHRERGDYRAWGRGGALAVLEARGEEGRAFLREIGRRGGQAVLERHGRQHLQELGRRGGRTTARKDGHLKAIAALGGQAVVSRQGSDYMQDLGRKGAQARWQKKEAGGTAMHVYYCKRCGKPVERSIEGELVCERCWLRGEADPALLAEEEALRRAVAASPTHCPDCGRPLVSWSDRLNGCCQECLASSIEEVDR